MLNKNGERELAYIARVTDILPIAGADRVEIARIQGWTCMVPKGAFNVGDLGVFFEADAKVPEKEPFLFMEKRNYKVKVQKFFKGTVVSDGLLMSFDDFGWEKDKYAEGDFLTKELGVTYAEAEDNKRKAASDDKYKKMAQRRPKLFKQPWARWMMRRSWGRKVMFFFFGKKRDKKSAWPAWVVKTDEERVQNLSAMLPAYAQERWIATEKVDGTSTTFTMKGFGRKREFYVCSRNVVFDKPDKKCFYDTNVYTEMAEKYNIEDILAEWLDMRRDEFEFITIQGETYGGGIQKRDYTILEHELAVFNVIFGYKDGHVERLNPYEMKASCDAVHLPCVPIIGTIEKGNLPTNCDDILAMAGGLSQIDGLPREGIVFRSEDGTKSFKAVDNNFIMKYHG